MRFLLKIFQNIGLVVLALLALFLLNVGAHRLLGNTDAEEAALAKLAEINARPARGDNAFALLWLMRYDVVDSQIETIAAHDAQRAQALLDAGEELDALIPADRPLLPAPSSNDPALCETSNSDCLARVKSNPEATRDMLSRYPRSLLREHNLETKGSYRSEFPAALGTPMPNPGHAQRLRSSELALAWHDGQRAEALAGICQNIAGWRRLRQGSDSLVVLMLAVNYIDSAIHLFAEMLSELPGGEALPTDCTVAFAPIEAKDVSMCTAMAGDFLLVGDALGQIERADAAEPDTLGRRLTFDWILPLLFDKNQTLATRAEGISESYCDDDAVQLALQDRLIDRQPTKTSLLACSANAIGCILGDIATPSYVGYPGRLLDSAANLRLGATLIWLRDAGDDARAISTRFTARPANMRSGTRASGVSEDGRSIWIDNFHQRRGERYSLPLAASGNHQNSLLGRAMNPAE